VTGESVARAGADAKSTGLPHRASFFVCPAGGSRLPESAGAARPAGEGRGMAEVGLLWGMLCLLLLILTLSVLGLVVQSLRIHSLKERIAGNMACLCRQRDRILDLAHSNRELHAVLRGKTLRIEQLERQLMLQKCPAD